MTPGIKTVHVCCWLVLTAGLAVACTGPDSTRSAASSCPQPRFTDQAPTRVYRLDNPLAHTESTISAGERLFQSEASPVACISCHGESGDGNGRMAAMFNPPPRNFTCAETLNNVPDGQLFWVIKNGSPGTSMPGFEKLSDQQIWQIVHYIRELSDGVS